MTDQILTFAGYWRDADGNWIRPDRMRAGGTGIRPEITLGWLFENVVPRLHHCTVAWDGATGYYTATGGFTSDKMEYAVADTPQAALIAALNKLLEEKDEKAEQASR